jgi:hypothetical protein
MVEKLEPERMRAEVSLEADLPQIAFRKLRQVRAGGGTGVADLCQAPRLSQRWVKGGVMAVLE